MLWSTPLLIISLALGVLSQPVDDHRIQRRLPSNTWYQDDGHPVHSLFKRGAPSDGVTYASVGSPTWSGPYPTSSPDVTQLPQEWVDALNAAVAAGKIPNISPSTNNPSDIPTYPPGQDPQSPEVCSGTYKCRIPGDIWDAPAGYMGLGFDDGPLPPTTALVNFLQNNSEVATHFMIGVNIINNPQEFLTAFNAGHDIAVHTWTHPYMTTLTNLELVAQFGWTAQLIHNSTGGRVPRYWRPPYGDSDTRVSAIAKEVFGLTTLFWNQDTEDWSLNEAGGTTLAKVATSMQQWLTGPKSPGLIILEHELTTYSVQAFMNAYPLIHSNGWNTASVTQLVNTTGSYQNSQNSTSPVTPLDIILGGNAPSGSSSSSSSQPSGTNSGSKSATPTDSKLQGSQKPSNSAVLSRNNTPWIILALLATTFSVLA